MLFQGILFLRLDVSPTDLNDVEFIGANAPQEHLLTTCLGVKRPLSFFLNNGDRKWPIVIADGEYCALGILGIDAYRSFIASFGHKFCSSVFVLYGIFRRNQIFAAWPQDFFQSGHIKNCCSMN